MRYRRDKRTCGNRDCSSPAAGVYVANGVGYCSKECMEQELSRQVREDANRNYPDDDPVRRLSLERF